MAKTALYVDIKWVSELSDEAKNNALSQMSPTSFIIIHVAEYSPHGCNFENPTVSK